ncbi:MAG: fumarylacetoacetate hydrolase family protein [Nocardioides sp.]
MSGFGIDHLPYGVFSVGGDRRRVGVRVDDGVLDLATATGRADLAAPSLNPFLAGGRALWDQTRAQVVALVESDTATIPLDEVELHLPFEVADYVDFYASEHHATNVGRLFRPDGDALLPNWKHLPVGYHGRSGTVVVSGTPITRPAGQRGPDDVGPTRRLDIEAELGFVVGAPSALGSPVSAAAFGDHVFGVVGLNDWSARDIQAWEYQPLGPFLGKSFATSISAWVTPLAALDASWCDLPSQAPRPAEYLDPDGARGLDIDVEVEVDGRVVTRPPYRSTYWGPSQMLAHMTVNGASVRTGDLFGSGTISGPEADQVGSLLELHLGERFLDDGTTVTLRYSAPGTAGGRITLGEVTGVIVAAESA